MRLEGWDWFYAVYGVVGIVWLLVGHNAGEVAFLFELLYFFILN